MILCSLSAIVNLYYIVVGIKLLLHIQQTCALKEEIVKSHLSVSCVFIEKPGPERKRIKKEPNTRKAGLPFGMGMPGMRVGYPLSERQQVALLMQMTAEESVNSPGACLSPQPRLQRMGA